MIFKYVIKQYHYAADREYIMPKVKPFYQQFNDNFSAIETKIRYVISLDVTATEDDIKVNLISNQGNALILNLLTRPANGKYTKAELKTLGKAALILKGIK